MIVLVLVHVLAGACAGPAVSPPPAVSAAGAARARGATSEGVPSPTGASLDTDPSRLATVPIPAAPSPPSADVAPAPVPPAPATKLAWVNPSRCLADCTADPGVALCRLDDRGIPDPRGKHRVDASAADALAEMLAAARTAGHTLRITSAFRSYRDQARVFRATKERGRAARPGHSEHQLGTAMDLRLPTGAAIAWLAEHAAEHGFALSYPPGKQRLTGYRPEPWHVRFVGRAVAAELHDRAWTLEEWFRVHPELGESGSCKDCPSAISRPSCGSVTGGGVCQGSVLTWCYEDALAAVDCAASGQTCGQVPGADTPDCRHGRALTEIPSTALPPPLSP